jgi:subtilisin family serine protease
MKLHCLLVALALSSSAWAQTTDQMVSREIAQAQSETYIVKFVEPGALYYDGGTQGIRGTSLRASGTRKFNANSPEAQAYKNFLRTRQAEYLQSISASLQRSAVALHNYEVMYNGVALTLTGAEAAKVRTQSGVLSVEPAGTFQVATDAGPNWIGAPAIWSGVGVPGNVGNRGQNIVIGTIDSGSNVDHPSFGNDANCGFSAANPKQLSAADCLSANCVGGNPEDTDPSGTGHGVHTASTSGGNALNTPLTVQGVNLRFNISGVAPCAKVRTYKVCATNSCDGAAIQSAIQRAITDQVDVINYSISGGNSPWTDADRGFLDAVNADIVVAASAGNTSATITNPVANVNHRGPWVMTVANSTHDRIEAVLVSVPGSLQNQFAQPGTGPTWQTTATASVAVASVLGNEEGCNPTAFPPNSMSGRIALIARGTCNFSEKVINATTAGAVGVLVYNNVGGPPIAMGQLGATTIPSAMLTQSAGLAFRNFLTTNPAAQVTIVGPPARVTDSSLGDILNASSLRGPNNTFDVTKPDITGPGTNIYAAIGDIAPAGGQAQFGFLSGTSMSGPHLAGSAALLRAAHPSWTPQEVKSAIQLTAKVPGFRQDAVTPWDADDVGNGRVDLTRAALSGLVMNETFANFLAANPGTGGNVRTLNLPSMRHTSCAGICQFTRVVRNTRTQASTWTVAASSPAGTEVSVQPASFSFSGDLAQTQTLVITVRITDAAGVPTLAFGDVRLSSAGAPEARMTLAIRGTAGASYRIGAPDTTVAACAGQTAGPISLSAITSNGATAPVTLSTVSAPAAFGTAVFAPNPVTPSGAGAPITLNIPITAGTLAGTYSLPFRGTATSHSFDGLINFRVSSGTPGNFTVSTPAVGATGIATNTGFSWTASANNEGYVIEISRDAAFASLAHSGNVSGTSFTLPKRLRENANYFWRVRASNLCGNVTASGNFTTVAADTLLSDGFFE